jgi:hypothetical protein
VVGDGVFYYVAIGSLLCILALSATTSFVDFPRLCRMVAEDCFLPRPFAIAGRRLVFTVGILYLAATAGALLFAFGGITDRLIPLYAIGAFLTFTISQAGMVVRWRRMLRQNGSAAERRAQHAHYWINGVGACATAAALVVIIVAKFTEGAWITILVIPAVIVFLKAVRRYYDDVRSHVAGNGPMSLDDTRPPILLVAVEEWNRPTDKALRLALTLSADVIGIHLSQLAGPQAEEHGRNLRDDWRENVETPAQQAGLPAPRLIILRAEHRSIDEPFVKLTEELDARFGARRLLVLIPEMVKRHWYQHFLHTHYADRLRSKLLDRGNTRLTVLEVPWYLQR